MVGAATAAAADLDRQRLPGGPWWVTVLIFAAVFGFVFFSAITGWIAAGRYRARRRQRVARVHAAAAEAAEDEEASRPRWSPPAEQLFRDIQTAWDDRDIPALERMVGPELMVEWRRRLDDFAAKGLHNRVVVRENTAEYVGMTNLPAEEDDRAVVRVSAVCDDWVVTRTAPPCTTRATRRARPGSGSTGRW